MIALAVPPAPAGAAPAIRTSAANSVPACVTPDRLMQFLRSRNEALAPVHRDIAQLYRRHGETWRVRWDYAFFQMALETNFLKFRRPDGERGDVHERQFNFAGLGATGGGVAGDHYPDVSTGVLAQIQHLVVYSGETLDDPVGHRTRLKQDDIVRASLRITRSRPVTFQDLSGRWATDRRYGRSLDRLASAFQDEFCRNGDWAAQVTSVPPPRPAARPTPTAPAQVVAGLSAPSLPALAGPPAPARRTGPSPAAPAAQTPPAPVACQVRTASFGGTRAVLIESAGPQSRELTVLGVHAGFERQMGESYMRSYAPGGRALGGFASIEAALTRALQLCPTARR